MADGGAVPRRRTRQVLEPRLGSGLSVRVGVCGQRSLTRPPTFPTSRSTAAPGSARAVDVGADGGAVPRRRARHHLKSRSGSSRRRLRAGSLTRPPTFPTSRSKAAPVQPPPVGRSSCRGSSRRQRCSYPPRRTTPRRSVGRSGPLAFAGSGRLDAGRPPARGLGQKQPRLFVGRPSWRRRSCRRRCSSPPRHTTPTDHRTT